MLDSLFKSKLASTLEKWEKRGGDLGSALYELGDYPVKKASDARAICRALASPRLAQAEPEAAVTSPLHALAGLFQDVASQEAYDELRTNGLPLLRRIVRERMASASEERARDLLDPEGRRRLRGWCLDPRHSQRAGGLLQELGFEDDIPAEAQDPDFQAMAEMCTWLAHPNEFGRAPDEIVLLDKRDLFWPPTDDTRTLWLFTYTYQAAEEDEEPDTGVGMVGSVTFALFGEATAALSPEDIYGLHCCWELKANGDSRAPEERTPEAGRRILAKRNPGFGVA